jgi:hypothetical protein
MPNQTKIYCFRANYQSSTSFNPSNIPDWLCLDANWQGYRISTLPWIADVARLLGILPLEENTLEAWIAYLESLGLKEITPICCEEFFEDTLFH